MITIINNIYNITTYLFMSVVVIVILWLRGSGGAHGPLIYYYFTITMPYHGTPYSAILYYMLYSATRNCTILCYAILYYAILYYTILYYATILYYTILYYTTLHYTTLHYTTLHQTTLHYTMLFYRSNRSKALLGRVLVLFVLL